MSVRTKLHRRAALLLAALCFAAGIATAWKKRAMAGGIDFYQYWVVARVLERSQPFDVYDRAQGERIGALYLRESLEEGHSRRERQAARARAQIEVYSTPFLYGAFGLFNSQSFETDLTRYELVCALFFALGLFGCCRAVGFGWTRALLLAGLTLLWFEPYHSDARVNNVNQLQLGLIGLFLWIRRRPLARGRVYASGMALGFAQSLKPNLGFAAGLLFLDALRRRFAVVAWTIAGALTAILSSIALGSFSFGSLDAWPRWFAALQRLLGESHAAYTVELGNYAFATALEEWTGLAVRPYLLAVAGLLATLACLWTGRHFPSPHPVPWQESAREAQVFGVGAFIVLLSSRLYWLHYAMLLLPMAIALLRPAQETDRGGRSRIRLGLGAVGCLLLAAQPPVRALSLLATPTVHLSHPWSSAVPACFLRPLSGSSHPTASPLLILVRMKAMVLRAIQPAEARPLALEEREIPEPAAGEIRVRVSVCGVCRTDLHVIEGDLPEARLPLIPGHEVVGTVDALGPGVTGLERGTRVGIAWVRGTCGHCEFCREGRTNLCPRAQFTGYHADGGYAEHALVPAEYAYPIPAIFSDEEAAPLLCAGIIGYRALTLSGVKPGERLGLYGFGASAHIVLQIARHRGCEVYVFSLREGHRALARDLGATWVGTASEPPPAPLHGSILFAPAGELVPPALRALAPGGTLACSGIHMTPIPTIDYDRELFRERVLRSVTANTREDGIALLDEAAKIPIRPHTRRFALEEANEALSLMKQGAIHGAAVLQAS